ncbi:hypothetical protein [Chryseobacterium gleum]|uniref:hypothetical protein n=1 Tax=Chryseobacterium gleum TaxID=250 RepID=UPI00289CCE18|nr:hypothetical protein [Chryseobacterium gleum]
MKNFYISLILSFLSFSCTSINEVHYYKDKVYGTNLPNYYRVTVHANSLFTSTRYLSGYFDQSAVNLYFNETTQPDKATFIVKDENTNKYEETGNELVILFSTRAQAISNNISNFSNNKSILDNIYKLSIKGKIEEAEKIEGEKSKFAIDTLNYIRLINLSFSELKREGLNKNKKIEILNKILKY